MIKDGGSYTWMTSFIIQVYDSIDVGGSYTWIDPISAGEEASRNH